MKNAHDTFDFSHAGREFRAYIVADDTADAPWEREEGHGPVRIGEQHREGYSDKKPWERPLNQSASSRYSQYYYDWREACKMAKRDGWNAAPYDAPGRVLRAVQADFDRLRAWLNDDWCYVGVCVCLLDDEGEEVGDPYAYALWGIESDCDDYIREVAEEHAEQILAEHAKAEALLDLHIKGL